MSRPKTTGDVITFRLPLDLHVVAESLAGRAGTNVSDYVKGRIVAGLERERDRLAQESARSEGAGCGHVRPVKLESGLWRCDVCGRVSSDRGVSWRSA